MKKLKVKIDGEITIKSSLRHLSKYDVYAKIIQPNEISGITVFAPHLPYFSTPKEDWYLKNDVITDEAIQLIEREMKRTFENYKIINENLADIRLKYNYIKIISYINNKDKALINDRGLKEHRSLLNRKFSKGEIDKNDYQRELNELRNLNDIFHKLQWGMIDNLRYYLYSNYDIRSTIWSIKMYIEKYRI